MHMSLSKLQQYILEACLEQRGRCSRRAIDEQAKHDKNVVTRSIERLIDRGFLVGYGSKTKEKLFITSVRITPSGRRTVYSFRASRQKKLPLSK